MFGGEVCACLQCNPVAIDAVLPIGEGLPSDEITRCVRQEDEDALPIINSIEGGVEIQERLDDVN